MNKLALYLTLAVVCHVGVARIQASPILYTMNFTATSGVAPSPVTSFVYDSDTAMFTNFLFRDNGQTYNLSLLYQTYQSVSCGGFTAQPSVADGRATFALLSGSCGPLQWEVMNYSSDTGIQSTYLYIGPNLAGYSQVVNTLVSLFGSTLPPGVGTVTVNAETPTPEPSTLALLMLTLIPVAVKRRR